MQENKLLDELQVLRRPAAARDVPALEESRARQRSQGLLLKVLLRHLCPKASTQNIPEYVALRECLRRGAQLGWPQAVCWQTWIVLMGIRGKEGVEAAAEIMGIGVPSWHEDAYWDVFCDRWAAKYHAAVQTTGRVAVFGHEEGLAGGMSGHHFVTALRSPVQRQHVRKLASELLEFEAHEFGPQQVMRVKELINASGLLLRLPTAGKAGAGLASSSGYNAMNWTRCFGMLLRELYGAAKIYFTRQMWTTMVQCQGGHDVSEALAFFGVDTCSEANALLRECPGLSWELLFVAVCESRQAWQHFQDEGKEFCRIVDYAAAHPQYYKVIRRYTLLICERGAKQKQCFSTRLFQALHKNILRRERRM